MISYFEIIKKGSNIYGHSDGFLYSKSHQKGDVSYWKCRKRGACPASLTAVSAGRNLEVRKGGASKSHNHAPNREEVAALKIIAKIKRDASKHPERPPTAVMRVLQEAEPTVQALLPERENIRKSNLQIRPFRSC